MYKPTLSFITELKNLTQHKDRYIKGNSIQLLKRLQEINPQDESDTCDVPHCNNKKELNNDYYCELHDTQWRDEWEKNNK